MRNHKHIITLPTFVCAVCSESVAYAHHCGSLSDCFQSIEAAVATAVSASVMVMLSMLGQMGPKTESMARSLRERIFGAPPYDEATALQHIGTHIQTQLAGRRLVPAPAHRAKAPFYELPSLSQVNTYHQQIQDIATEFDVDPDLVRAIMFMETTHGYRDGVVDNALLGWTDLNVSVLPMNIHYVSWGRVANIPRSALEDPITNIRIGTHILREVHNSLPSGARIAEIATVYNNLHATRISTYGQRVAEIYRTKPWQ
jgi:hypothetical protein